MSRPHQQEDVEEEDGEDSAVNELVLRQHLGQAGEDLVEVNRVYFRRRESGRKRLRVVGQTLAIAVQMIYGRRE